MLIFIDLFIIICYSFLFSAIKSLQNRHKFSTFFLVSKETPYFFGKAAENDKHIPPETQSGGTAQTIPPDIPQGKNYRILSSERTNNSSRKIARMARATKTIATTGIIAPKRIADAENGAASTTRRASR